jgi:hypothetical protein
MFLAGLFIAFAALLAGGWQFLHPHCRHRFGLPLRGQVRCMRCTQCFAIETNAHGEWKIKLHSWMSQAGCPRAKRMGWRLIVAGVRMLNMPPAAPWPGGF